MQTSLLNSKKCLTASVVLGSLWGLLCLAGNYGFANTVSPTLISSSIQRDLRESRSKDFSKLLKNWEALYGSSAVNPLLEIAKNTTKEDTERYMALMGATKLGGVAISKELAPFLTDRSWMLRSGAIRALKVLNVPRENEKILSLLKDPALVVRVEALEALAILKPAGTPQAFVDAIFDNQNYHKGKAQWIPQKALAQLPNLFTPVSAKPILPRLLPLLEKNADPKVLLAAVNSIESLAQIKTLKGQPLSTRITQCKKIIHSIKR